MNDNCKVAAAKNPQVQQEMQKLHKEIESVGEVLNNLRVRLQPVLEMKPPSVAEKLTGMNRPTIVQLADEIRNAREKVSRLSDDVLDMLNTCEL